MNNGWYIYIVKCSDDTFYTGITTDIERRLDEHNEGDGAKYTRGRTSVELVYSEEFENQSKAAIRESEIKSFGREKKKKLIK